MALALLSLGACGSAPELGPADAAAPPADAASFLCAEPADLELGACQRDDGQPCTGAAGELARFVALPEGGELRMVQGPQGATMFVLAVRTRGLAPGDPAQPASVDNPLVDIHLVDASDRPIGRYRGRVALREDAVGTQEAAGLFVVVDGAGAALEHALLTANGEVVDRAGARRCGRRAFMAMP